MSHGLKAGHNLSTNTTAQSGYTVCHKRKSESLYVPEVLTNKSNGGTSLVYKCSSMVDSSI